MRLCREQHLVCPAGDTGSRRRTGGWSAGARDCSAQSGTGSNPESLRPGVPICRKHTSAASHPHPHQLSHRVDPKSWDPTPSLPPDTATGRVVDICRGSPGSHMGKNSRNNVPGSGGLSWASEQALKAGVATSGRGGCPRARQATSGEVSTRHRARRKRWESRGRHRTMKAGGTAAVPPAPQPFAFLGSLSRLPCQVSPPHRHGAPEPVRGAGGAVLEAWGHRLGPGTHLPRDPGSPVSCPFVRS